MDTSVQQTLVSIRLFIRVLKFFHIRSIWKFSPSSLRIFVFQFVCRFVLRHIGSAQPVILQFVYRCSRKGLLTKRKKKR